MQGHYNVLQSEVMMLNIEEIAKTVPIIGDDKLIAILNDAASSEGFDGYCDSPEVMSYTMKLASEKLRSP